MKIVCLTVGKKHDPSLVDAMAEYEKRLSAYVQFDFSLVTPSNIQTESEAILKRLDADDYVLLLDETGRQLNNIDLAHHFADLQQRSVRRMVMIIGGAYGVTQDVKQRSDCTLSFSKLVFPHQIMRLLVVEQVYRSYNLLAGGKYHHN
jgi:23S rRNA (pseudouridine1915-N3)-methyltransferase